MPDLKKSLEWHGQVSGQSESEGEPWKKSEKWSDWNSSALPKAHFGEDRFGTRDEKQTPLPEPKEEARFQGGYRSKSRRKSKFMNFYFLLEDH